MMKRGLQLHLSREVSPAGLSAASGSKDITVTSEGHQGIGDAWGGVRRWGASGFTADWGCLGLAQG